MKKIFLTYLLFLSIFLFPVKISAQQIDFSITLEKVPPASRFKGFTAIIPASVLQFIEQDSIKFYINGEDFSRYLKYTLDSKTASLCINYSPTVPLPLGQVNEKIKGLTKDGKNFEKLWSFFVDPFSDKELAKYYNILKKEPKNINAHLNLGKLYEKKYLLKDAQNEYLTVLQVDPASEEARKGYERIFSLWDGKMIRYGKLCVEIFMDTGLLSLGKLLIFNVTLTNEGEAPINITPEKWVLVDEGGNKIEPLSSLSGYPKKIMDKKLISMEDYARLSYYLNSHSYSLLKTQDIAPASTIQGFLIYSYTGKFKKVIISIPEQDVSGSKQNFVFPFILP